MRLRFSLILLGCAALLAGCGSIRYHLPSHSAQAHTAPVELQSGERRLALSTPARIPVPGGFWLSLASEDPTIVRIHELISQIGSNKNWLVGVAPGRTMVHYVNRFTVVPGRSTAAEIRAASLGAFEVRVAGEPPRPGSDTKTPHRSTTTEIGTAIIQDLREGVLRFDFTPDQGPTLQNLRVRAAEIDDLRDTPLEPGVRLRLRLVREFLQLGTTTPREVSRRWEALRTR